MGQIATTSAIFTAATSLGSNTLSTAVLQAPSNVTTTVQADRSIRLNWTASPSTFATGYYIFRSGSSGTQGPKVATVTPRTTVTWTDTAPLDGPNYYTVQAYAQNWESGNLVSPPVTPPPVEITDNFNGSGVPGSSEIGGKAWQQLNGTWSRNGAGFVRTTNTIGANPMLVADLGSPNADITVTTTDSSGEAAYGRVVDGNNWLRSRVKKTQVNESYTYYVTEYEHVTSYTEYQFQPYVTEAQYEAYIYEHLWQPYVTETLWNHFVHEDQYDTGAWGPWIVYANSACQATKADVSVPANVPYKKQYRVGDMVPRALSGCPTGKNMWNKEERGWGYSGTRVWLDTFATPPAGYIWTGTSRDRDTGEDYWAVSKFWQIDTSTGQTRNVPSGDQYWAVNARKSIDAWTGQARPITTGTYYYGAQRQAIDQPTGVTRNVASGTPYWDRTPRQSIDQVISSRVISSSTWSETPCTGCNTRSSARTGYQLVDKYAVVLEKAVGGTVTQINSWAVPSIDSLRLVVSGNSISVYRNGTTLVGTATDATHNTATLHGCGLGGTDTVTPTDRLNYVSIKRS